MRNNEQNNRLEEVKQFVQENIRPHAGEFERQGEFPRSLMREMGRRGYMSASFPEECGGWNCGPQQYGRLLEEIGKGALSAAMLLTVTSGLVGETLVRWGTKFQKENYVMPIARGEKIASFALSEPLVGSDAKSVETSYVRQGDAYVITGSKKWISFGEAADFFIVIAADKSTRKISAFIVNRDQAGVRTKKMTGLMSCAASHIAEIELDSVVVDADHRVGEEGMGFAGIVNTALDNGRFHVAWMGVGIAQEALEVMIAYSRQRKQFGQKIHTFQLIQGIIGDAVTQIHAARSLCLDAARLREEKHPDAAIQSTIAKYFCSQVANQVCGYAVQVLGANGISDRYPAERLYREAKILEIIEGSSQIQQQVIAMHGLNAYYDRRRRRE